MPTPFAENPPAPAINTRPTIARRASAPPNQRVSECWVQPGGSVTIQGRKLDGGMLYVGSGLRAGAPGWDGDIEPALLNPALQAGTPGSGRDAEFSYWPRYADLDASGRAAVLDWLASGRSDPSVQIGAVFIYLYGLERRLLIDKTVQNGNFIEGESSLLIAEIERLQSIYGSNSSFRSCCADLLLWAQILHAGKITVDIDLTPSTCSFDSGALVALGQHAINETPIPSGLALHWYLASDLARLRTPAKRCWSHFVRLFELRYAAHFGGGLVVRANKSRLKLNYQPASPGLRGLAGKLRLPVDLPDVSRLSRPVKKLAALVEECQSALDSYSRWLGRNPDQPPNMEAVALLPADLGIDTADNKIKTFRMEVEGRIADQEMVVVPSEFLFSHWESTNPDKMKKKEAVGLAQLLERMGFAMEPDVRLGGAPPTRNGAVTLFRQDIDDAVSAASEEYASALLVLQLAILVASADGTVDYTEEKALESHLERSLRLSAAERKRLRAHMRWMIAAGPRFAGLKKRLEMLDIEARRELGSFVVVMANADGHIDPTEIKVLRRIYSMLQLDPDDVYADVHAAQTDPDRGPVAIRAPESRSAGRRIPRPPAEHEPAPPPSKPAIDMARVQQKLLETARVSAMLDDIFADDDDDTIHNASVVVAKSHEESTAVGDLEPSQVAFLQALSEAAEWTPLALETLAEKHSIMLDGTIEAINECGFERFDQPIIEWDDPVEVDITAAKELLA